MILGYKASIQENTDMAENNLIKVYVSASSSMKVNLIIKNYSSFIGIIDGYTEGLRYTIECEKESIRRQAKGETGVHVQGGCFKSDPTAKQGIGRVMTRDALIRCDFSDDVLEGVEQPDVIMSSAYILRRMRDDYELFNSQLDSLGREKEVFKKYLTGEMSLSDIAEKNNITYESAQQKIHKIRSRVRKQVVGFMDGTTG